MVRGSALPVADKADSTNRKKHRVMRVVMSRTTMFLTETEIGKSIRFMILKVKQTLRQMASLCNRKIWGPQKVGSSKRGVKTARLQVVSRFERDFLGRGRAVEFCKFLPFQGKTKKMKLATTNRGVIVFDR